jgi:hypothetical protein
MAKKLQSEIEYWIPGGSMAYCGTPKTRWRWIRMTWRGYFAYWRMLFRAMWMLRNKEAKHG